MDTRGLSGAGARPDSHSRTVLSPYDPVHGSTTRRIPLAPPISTPPYSQHATVQPHEEPMNNNSNHNHNRRPLRPENLFLLPDGSNRDEVPHSIPDWDPNRNLWDIRDFASAWAAPAVVNTPSSPGLSYLEAYTQATSQLLGRSHLNFHSVSAPAAGAPGNTAGETHSSPVPHASPTSTNGPTAPQQDRHVSLADILLSSPAGLLRGSAPRPSPRPTSTTTTISTSTSTTTIQTTEPVPLPQQQRHQAASTSSFQHPAIRLITPPSLDRRRQQQLHNRNRRAMSSQPPAAPHVFRAERNYANRATTNNPYPGGSRAENARRRDRDSEGLSSPPPGREDSFFYSRDIQRLRDVIASDKRVASKHALRSLEAITVAELPEDERTCIICYNEFGSESPEGVSEVPLRLPKCKHVFGSNCIKKWFQESDNCPYCRDKVPGEPKNSTGQLNRVVEYARNHGFLRMGENPDGLIENIMQNLPELRRRRGESGRAVRTSGPNGAHTRLQQRYQAATSSSRMPTESHDGYTPLRRSFFVTTPPLPEGSSPLSEDSMDEDLSQSTGTVPTTPPSAAQNTNTGRQAGSNHGLPMAFGNYLSVLNDDMSQSGLRDIVEPGSGIPAAGNLSPLQTHGPPFPNQMQQQGVWNSNLGATFEPLAPSVERYDRSGFPGNDLSPGRGQGRRGRPWL